MKASICVLIILVEARSTNCLGYRVQLQLSGSKSTADHTLATGQPWPLLLCHSEKLFSKVKVICSDFFLWEKSVLQKIYAFFAEL